MSFSDECEWILAQMLRRYLRQNGLAELPPADVREMAIRLMALIDSRGLPAPLRPSEIGEAGEMSADEVAPLTRFLLEGIGRAEDLATVTRQLVKACFQPEFKKCRESYGEVEANGSCRRQELQRVQTRLSGSHCVDCPYWTSLTPEQHTACLEAGWVGAVGAFHAHQTIFLPEDFRAFRRLIRARAARGSKASG